MVFVEVNKKKFFAEWDPDFKDTHREKHPKIKLQHLQKIGIERFESLVQQINSFYEVLKLKQIFQKKTNKAVTGKDKIEKWSPFK